MDDPLIINVMAAPSEEREEAPTAEAVVVVDEQMKGPVTGEALSGSRRRASRRWRALTVLLLSLSLFGGLWLSLTYLNPFGAASATVTLIPVTADVATSAAVGVVTNGAEASPSRREIAGRLLASLSITQARSVATTGVGYRRATAARGTITLYNALPVAQFVPAGTLLIGTDGVQVTTGRDASIPAAAMPVEGQAEVPAHTLQVGSGGNIAAYDISGPCCRADVFAQNRSAFTGGQDARRFPMVTEQDFAGALAVLKAALEASAQAAFRAQLGADEALVAPLSCAHDARADHAAGDEASQLTVSLTETCSGEAYSVQGMRALAQRLLSQEAARRLDSGYVPSGDIEVAVSRAAGDDQGRGEFLLRVAAREVWSYRFNQAQFARFARLIAGKSKSAVPAILLRQPGVGAVSESIAGPGGEKLPADPRAIHFVVLYGG